MFFTNGRPPCCLPLASTQRLVVATHLPSAVLCRLGEDQRFEAVLGDRAADPRAAGKARPLVLLDHKRGQQLVGVVNGFRDLHRSCSNADASCVHIHEGESRKRTQGNSDRIQHVFGLRGMRRDCRPPARILPASRHSLHRCYNGLRSHSSNDYQVTRAARLTSLARKSQYHSLGVRDLRAIAPHRRVYWRRYWVLPAAPSPRALRHRRTFVSQVVNSARK